MLMKLRKQNIYKTSVGDWRESYFKVINEQFHLFNHKPDKSQL